MMLTPLLRLAPGPGTCSLPSFDWPLTREYAHSPPSFIGPLHHQGVETANHWSCLRRSTMCARQRVLPKKLPWQPWTTTTSESPTPVGLHTTVN
eukprot:4957016-Pyramimonas_sp.AAC.1